MVLLALASLAFATFLSLGTWQLERRAWKHALVARVEQRVHAPAVAAPGPDAWPKVNAADDEYRHVRLTGHFLHDRATLVQAVTVRGSGFWLLTPLRTTDSGTVLVNRGFVPSDAPRAEGAAGTETTVTGLLRITEPGGAFLRDNDPADNRWFSRDVAAITTARGLAPVAPYFVDADATRPEPPEATGAPIGGLTVISFPDNHLVYALTWYALALMVVGAAWRVVREDRRPRHDATDDNPGDADGGRNDGQPD